MSKKKIFCVIGQTCSGKSSITKNVASDLGLKILRSYTTRGMRDNETVENSDHTFISDEEVDKYRDEMVAYTDRAGYCSFATKTQLMESDIYIINPSGFIELKNATKDMDVDLIDIWIECPRSILKKRAILRGTWKSWVANMTVEQAEFDAYIFDKTYILSNRDEPLSYAVERMKKIINKELSI